MTAPSEALLLEAMDCAEVQKFVHPFIDGEFEPGERARFAAHLVACARCRELVSFEESFKASLRARLARPTVPPALRERLQGALDAAPSPSQGLAWRAFRIAPIAAAAGLFCLVTSHPHDLATVTGDVVGTHARNLPIEVPGPDPGRVRTWFDGKVDFPVDPPRIEGARLVGARLGYVHDREAAELQYRNADGDRVSVFIFDPRDLDLAAPRARRIEGREVYFGQQSGYSVAAFRNKGMGYAITGDVNEDQMAQIVSASFTP